MNGPPQMVFEHTEERGTRWAAIRSISSKLGMSAETLRLWVTTDERARMKELEHVARPELRANGRQGTATADASA